MLPITALVGEAVLCMHGGIPRQDLESLDVLNNFSRPCDIPEKGIMCDLLWADPNRDSLGVGINDRGVSYTFGPDLVKKFCQKHDLDLIVRAHEVVQDGYWFFAERKLLTIFSASNYQPNMCNAASMLTLDEDMKCGIIVSVCLCNL
jgi:serine/threonine-protein phosphatase PP1 catalytic subunit